ncbi:hypothetical protein [Mariniflexile sp.]|uniref:hypothetical protein n=1 Tax=Mariniflexile sp. TaxID=1979402 RepID=UPI00404877DB
MKRILTFITLALFFTLFTSFYFGDTNYSEVRNLEKLEIPNDEGFYTFLTTGEVDESYSNNSKPYNERDLYLSDIIYYPGQNNCGGKEDYVFWGDAKKSFGLLLTEKYPKDFPYGAKHIYHARYSGERYKTRQEAQDAMTSWIIQKKKIGHTTFIRTDFNYGCN